MNLKPSFRAGTLLLGTALLAGCGKNAVTPNPLAPSVTVSRPSREQVGEAIEMTGTLAPSRSEDLVARVTGYLRSVNFQDGSFVEAGQLLFVIEPEPYEEQLALAKAAFLRADAEYARQEALSRSNATSVANVEKWLSERDQAKAQVELAKLNLDYTRVTAPFSGRIGRRLVDPGNLVSPTGNYKLATLDQLVPLYAYFNLNEREALRLWEIVRKRGGDRRAGMAQTVVEIGLQTEEGWPHSGTLDFVDTGVSTSSGAITMRALFKNEDKVLFPGLFARVRIPFGEPQPMLVVPGSAIGNDQEGDYVMVVDANDVVVRRSIVKGPPTKNGCTIRSGLSPEDRVIIAGLLRVKPGAKVTPASAGPGDPAAADSQR